MCKHETISIFVPGASGGRSEVDQPCERVDRGQEALAADLEPVLSSFVEVNFQ